jgi:hypothetical protein
MIPSVGFNPHGQGRLRTKEAEVGSASGPSFGELLSALGASDPLDESVTAGDDEIVLESEALIFNQDGYFDGDRPMVTPPDGARSEAPAPSEAGRPSGESPVDLADSAPPPRSDRPVASPEGPVKSAASNRMAPASVPPRQSPPGVAGGARQPGEVIQAASSPARPSGVPNSTRTVIRTASISVLRPNLPGSRVPATIRLLKSTLPEATEDLGTADRLAFRRGSKADSGGALNVQLSVAPMGDILNLGIRLGRLSRDQRVRLREEITQLLARYGLSPGEVVMNGEIEPERSL